MPSVRIERLLNAASVASENGQDHGDERHWRKELDELDAHGADQELNEDEDGGVETKVVRHHAERA